MPDEDRVSLTAVRLQEIRGSLQRIVEPLRQELQEIEDALTEIDQIRHELVEARREIAAVIRAADPDARAAKLDAAAKARAAKKNGGATRSSRISNERVDELNDWLHANAHRFPDGFTAPDLDADEDVQLERTAINTALNTLHDRGVIRLDGVRRGGHGTPPKLYKLTAP